MTNTRTFADLENLADELLAPRDPMSCKRDECGFLTHPAMPVLGEDVSIIAFLAAFGLEVNLVYMESDCKDQAALDRYFDEGVSDCSAWVPTRPAGDGWALLEIFDTEEGPIALFARRKAKAPAHARRARSPYPATVIRGNRDAGELVLQLAHQVPTHLGAGSSVALLWPAMAISDAARDVLSERARQVSSEGHTHTYDDVHVDGALSLAAAAYATYSLRPTEDGRPPLIWPWASEWWKPSTPRRNLEKAGALILAELERLDRAAALPEETAS